MKEIMKEEVDEELKVIHAILGFGIIIPIMALMAIFPLYIVGSIILTGIFIYGAIKLKNYCLKRIEIGKKIDQKRILKKFQLLFECYKIKSKLNLDTVHGYILTVYKSDLCRFNSTYDDYFNVLIHFRDDKLVFSVIKYNELICDEYVFYYIDSHLEITFVWMVQKALATKSQTIQSNSNFLYRT